MRAAVYERYGPPEVVQIKDIPKPVPKDDEVLVRVRAATVCAADYRLRKADPTIVSLFNGLLRPKRIRTLGMELSGTVESAGKAATRFNVGDEVFGGTLFKLGTHAEYVCVPENLLAMKPVNLPLEDAAAFFFGGMTVLGYLANAPPIQPGDRVLVYGASGSVGVFAVQFAKHFGAHVTGVCSTSNLDMVRSLGADEVIDYTREDFSRAGRIYDMIFDTVGKSGYWRSLRSLKRGGRYVLIAGLGIRWFPVNMAASVAGELWGAITGKAKVVGMPKQGDRPQRLNLCKELIEAGKLRTVIERRYSLDQIADAHRHAEGGHKKGHVLIVLEQTSPRGA